jgi:hypothetical protein
MAIIEYIYVKIEEVGIKWRIEGLIDLSGDRVRATYGVFSVWGTPRYATDEDHPP